MARTEAERRAHYARQPKNKPRVSVHQVLASPDERDCIFYAVIVDPETQKRISWSPFYSAYPGGFIFHDRYVWQSGPQTISFSEVLDPERWA